MVDRYLTLAATLPALQLQPNSVYLIAAATKPVNVQLPKSTLLFYRSMLACTVYNAGKRISLHK